MRDTDLSRRLVETRPSERQVAWQQLEFTAFFHFGINTFTDREWGTGQDDISLFNPRELDTDQWCEGLRSAGIRSCIFTAKHHDGFCLWNTRFTDHSVMHTPYGQDILAKLAVSCQKYGLKLGVYLSPWDRHEATYGQGKAYDDYFCSQLEELLTGYGPLYTVWFDGANGEGPNGKKQVYDWPRYYELIRRLQPEAVISICGPDVRWCGNEAGDCRTSEWSVVPERLRSQRYVAQHSQQEDSEAFRRRKLSNKDEDLGSRALMAGEQGFIWYPAEVDTSIRPGWFYHATEDDKVRPLETLKRIYLNSVGGNSVLLLNIPPDRRGLLADPDLRRLEELGHFVKDTFAENLAERAVLSADYEEEGHEARLSVHQDETFYRPSGCPEEAGMPQVAVECRWKEPVAVEWVVLQEQIRESQRVESFRIEAWNGEHWQCVFEGTVIGYKKICHLEPLKTEALRIVFQEYRLWPTLRYLGVY